MESEYTDINYCHDGEIEETALRSGISDPVLRNRAKSIGEGPYNALDYAMEILAEYSRSLKAGRLPRTALSKKQKRAILERHGYKSR